MYYPVEVEPYTPSSHFARGKADPAFRTKPQIALELVEQAQLSQPERAALKRWHPRLRSHPATSLEELPQLARRRKALGVVGGWDAQRMVAPPAGMTWHAPLLALPAERVAVLREILLEQRPPEGPSGKAPA